MLRNESPPNNDAISEMDSTTAPKFRNRKYHRPERRLRRRIFPLAANRGLVVNHLSCSLELKNIFPPPTPEKSPLLPPSFPLPPRARQRLRTTDVKPRPIMNLIIRPPLLRRRKQQRPQPRRIPRAQIRKHLRRKHPNTHKSTSSPPSIAPIAPHRPAKNPPPNAPADSEPIPPAAKPPRKRPHSPSECRRSPAQTANPNPATPLQRQTNPPRRLQRRILLRI